MSYDCWYYCKLSWPALGPIILHHPSTWELELHSMHWLCGEGFNITQTFTCSCLLMPAFIMAGCAITFATSFFFTTKSPTKHARGWFHKMVCGSFTHTLSPVIPLLVVRVENGLLLLVVLDKKWRFQMWCSLSRLVVAYKTHTVSLEMSGIISHGEKPCFVCETGL